MTERRPKVDSTTGRWVGVGPEHMRARRRGRPGWGRRRGRPRRSWPQRLVILLGGLSSLALAGSSAGLAYLYRKVERIPRVELSTVLDQVNESGAPRNYLIVGIDDDEGLDPDHPVRAGRDGERNTDTIMVVRVDPASQHATLLSLPRDLWVPYPDGSHHRINGAMVRNNMQPDLLIGIINDYLGIPIHHYVQVDFAGFYDLVDAIGGVPVYFPLPARDTNSGLAVYETGCVTLDPEMALGYARSRHYEELVEPDADPTLNRNWEPDNLNDYGRIARQQDFIRRALERAVNQGARNPGKLDQLLDVGLGSVTIDDDLTPGAIFDLARRFSSFDPDSLENLTVPTVEDQVGEADILRLVESQAEPILARFRDPSAPPGEATDPGELSDADQDGEDNGGTREEDGFEGEADVPVAAVRVTVLNGSGATGEATETADALAEVGFTILSRRDADEVPQASTSIRYPAGSRDEAETLARWLEVDAELVEVPAEDAAAQAGIELTTGLDWEGVRSEPRSASPRPPTTRSTSTTLDSSTDVTDDPGDEPGSRSEVATSDQSTTTSVPHPPC
jgi:LCP family protein required for cell wall assembly